MAEEPGQISIQQSRFLSTGDVKPEEDQTTWWIPLGFKSGPQLSETRPDALTLKEDTLRNVSESHYKINSNQNAFFRTNYPPERLARLGDLREHLTVEDRIGLIGDAAALAVAGYATTVGLLSFLEGFMHEENYL